MKTLIALLASTSICFAASVGVSEDQLRGSGQDVPLSWVLVANFHHDDGSETGAEISRIIHEFSTQRQCEAVRDQHKADAKASQVTLECRRED